MTEKRLKIGYGIRSNASAHAKLKEFPKLTIAGNWFAKAGFKIGDVVTIEILTEKLILKVEGGEQNG